MLSPVPGTAVPLQSVPDPVFAQGLVGPGAAVEPDDGDGAACAPIAGTVTTVRSHAFVIEADDGRAILVHLGIDTVGQQGAGFTPRVARGARVGAGDPVVGWVPADVRAAGYSAVVPVVALDAAGAVLADLVDVGRVTASDVLFHWTG
ncbi:PTS sugar transporter subunit IIA [Saccharomonospora halophila]|uniref:PTS sugar transporter subunit IIA n=1 Tax=Saccharomonospora halophila TaxID=129922 RepID=UPI001E33584F|nr:PTS glucose transporter subunit IIA [Saccharomonospora halophila]